MQEKTIMPNSLFQEFFVKNCNPTENYDAGYGLLDSAHEEDGVSMVKKFILYIKKK
jgi:hypothetical protein